MSLHNPQKRFDLPLFEDKHVSSTRNSSHQITDESNVFALSSKVFNMPLFDNKKISSTKTKSHQLTDESKKVLALSSKIYDLSL